MGIFDVFGKKKEKNRELGAKKSKTSDAAEKIPKKELEEKTTKSGASETGVGAIRKDFSGIFLKPLITEKASFGEAFGKYTFAVSSGSSKPAIKKAVEEIYKTKVLAVNLMNIGSKRLGRMRQGYGRRPSFRKAVVTLRTGEKINFT